MTTPASNWAGNQRWLVADRVTPRSTEEVATIVRRAAAAGRRVKAIGGGHSFTAAASTDGIQISLDAMSRVLETDVDRGRVRVQAGIRLRALNDELAAVGLALPNLGDIDRQSIAGAIATATHGTGLGLGNLATTVVGMELVSGAGDVVRVDAASDPELLRVARVGLGALGIVTEVTLQCVPAFRLHARETIEVLDDVLDGFAEQAAAVDHFELYWMPGGGTRCQVKRNRRTDEPARPQSRLGYIRDKWIGENLAFGLVCRVGRRFPTAVPRVAELVTSSAGERDLVDRSDRIFCSPRHVHFVEMEYGLPIEHVPDAVRQLRDFARRLPTPVLFPVEVRVSAADDIPLSTGFGRTSGWVAVHQYRGMPHEEYFAGVERIMDDLDGRPHWGKLHGQRAATLAGRYPQWVDFRAARDRLDPARTFANAYLDRVLD
ncbi:MAG: D-arabinono-1,4-lactone oxidase [Ilumatobacteraceae bacterium]